MEKENQHITKKEEMSNEHEGKYFIIPKGFAECNQGFKPAHFKVTSHKHHYWNDEKAGGDYLAVTEDDV